MLKGPVIRLSVDLARMDRYFPLEHGLDTGIDREFHIDRQRYDKVEAVLAEHAVSGENIILEICYIILWIEEEIGVTEGLSVRNSKFFQMRAELDDLKQYLLKHRITSITLRGEFEKDMPGEEVTLVEETNIDRICDGLRTTFREEFDQDIKKRKKRGLMAWQRRKLVKIRNKLLHYFSSVPQLDELSLEDQNQVIDRLINLASTSSPASKKEKRAGD